MEINRVIREVAELKELVDSWGSSPSNEQRDEALASVKSIYTALRFNTEGQSEQVAEQVVEAAAEQSVEEIVVEEAVEETVESVETIESETLEPTETLDAPEVTEELPEPSTPDRTEEQRRERRQRIISLYTSTPTNEPSTEEPEQVEQVDQTANTPSEVAPPEPAPLNMRGNGLPSLGSMLTLNDRFLLSNDLFDGNMVQFNSALIALDAQRTLDDALLYIAENFRWNGDSDGAKLLNELLINRYKE